MVAAGSSSLASSLFFSFPVLERKLCLLKMRTWNGFLRSNRSYSFLFLTVAEFLLDTRLGATEDEDAPG